MTFTGKVPVICGPTGSGKTAIALDVARKIPIEIISADSGQMVRKLNIGTAKPTKDEQDLVSFHLIDIINPGEKYSAYRFVSDADAAISQVIRRNRLPVVVGGTGLYLKALAEGVFEIEEDNLEIRQKLESEMEQFGAREMYNKLKNIDPAEAANIHLNNKRRVTRALEIYYLTGKPKSELIKTGKHRRSRFEFEFYRLMPPRERLYSQIEKRVEQMLSAGLLAEVRALKAAGLAQFVQKMNVIGYNELIEHINGNISLEDAVLLIKQNSRRYAKRQYTWFRHQITGRTFTTKNELKRAFLSAFKSFMV
jgi:tRNA dimethylallyltransferase